MKLSKVGNQTNSQDPQAVNSRVFVGNLNTFQCSKTDVERMFQRYGRLAGISMHKGYAFVQFTNPFDARSACLGEDGRTILSQILDVNMVAEPKPHQTGRKRQNMSKTGNDWDYYYDSYCASAAFPPRLAPPLKRPRLMPTRSQQQEKQEKQQQQQQQQQQQIQQQQPKQQKGLSNVAQDLSQLKVYSNPDILICGNCREMFTDLSELLEHKRDYCKLRFTCKCFTFNGATPSNSTASLMCALCKDFFPSAWELMVHAQAAHMINIYELGSKSDAKYSRSPGRNNKESSQSPSPQDQDNKRENSEGDDQEEQELEEELDNHVLVPSPDSGKSTDNENNMSLSPIKIRCTEVVNGSSVELAVDCVDHQMTSLVENRNTTTCYATHRPIAIESTLELNPATTNVLSSQAETILTALTNGSITAKE